MSSIGGSQNHDKSERDLHKQNDEHEQGNVEAMEIDLKCAEKVTDSDVESNADDKVRRLNIITFQALLNISFHFNRMDHIKRIRNFMLWAM